jgi:CDP-6-deoxy-D-xylo-4-hexulose-3-dehydrase
VNDRKSEELRLTAEIVERMRTLARLRAEEAQEPFVPGKSPVRYAGRVYGEEEMANLAEASAEFWLTAGRWHRRLETELADWYGVKHARLVNSGSSANLLAVAALTSHLLGDRKLIPGDEVITVAAGFPTTVAPMIQHGLVPVFVDVDVATCNADVSQLEAALSPRTRAVMMAHTLGNPFDLAAVKAFCDRHDLWLVEDNCDAAGSTFQGKKTGTFGHLATLSFYPPHHMTTGEGGAVLTSDGQLLRAVESLRDWGRDCWCQSGVDNTCGKRFEWQLGELPSGYDHKYVYSHLGYNLKMTDLQASVGVAQLARLDGFAAARRKNWASYREALDDLQDVLVLPEPTPDSDPSWFGFLVSVRPGAPITRDDLVRKLEGQKIQTRMLFAGNLVRQPAMTELAKQAKAAGRALPYRTIGRLEHTDVVMNHSLWVGVYPGLTEAMRSHVVETFRKAFGKTA